MLRADAKCIHVDCEIHIAQKIENKCEVNCALIKSFETLFFFNFSMSTDSLPISAV